MRGGMRDEERGGTSMRGNMQWHMDSSMLGGMRRDGVFLMRGGMKRNSVSSMRGRHEAGQGSLDARKAKSGLQCSV